MSILIRGMTPEQLLDVFSWARIGANNCMIGDGVTAIELPDHGDLIDRDALNREMYHEAFETDSALQKWDSGCWIRYKMFEKHRDAAPVVIPAERREE